MKKLNLDGVILYYKIKCYGDWGKTTFFYTNNKWFSFSAFCVDGDIESLFLTKEEVRNKVTKEYNTYLELQARAKEIEKGEII